MKAVIEGGEVIAPLGERCWAARPLQDVVDPATGEVGRPATAC